VLEETRNNPLPLSPRHLAQIRQCRLRFGEHKGCPCPLEDFNWDENWCMLKIKELIERQRS
jgi:hypothetical protein